MGETTRINPTPRRTRAASQLSHRHRRPYSASTTGLGCSWPSSRRVPGARDGAVIPTSRAAEMAEAAEVAEVARCRYSK